MANVFVDENSLTAIADAIRTKNGTATTYKPSEMADAIENISSGGITPTGTISITQNGTTDVTNYASASVNVPNSYSASDEGKVVSNGALVAQTSETYTANNTYDTTTINSVTVNVSGGVTPTGTKQISITQNGTTTEDVTNYASAEITVNVPSSGFDIDDYTSTGFTGDVTVPTATSLRINAFIRNTGLISLYAPCVTTAEADVTYGSDHMELLRLPELLTTTGASFRYMSQTSKNCVVVLPKITSMAARTFDRSFCSKVDLGNGLTAMYADTFYNNTEGQTVGDLILRYNGVVSASTTDAIKGLRNVYVPSAQISAYQVASKWATRYDAGYITFHAIEGSVYETAYADGTPITTN